MLVTSALYIGLCAVIGVLLFANVSRLRIKHKSLFDDVDRQGNRVRALKDAVRAHGNFIENAPFLLLILAAMELTQMGALYLHIFGIALIFSRVGHAFTVLNHGPFPLRATSVLITWALYAVGGVVLIATFAAA